MKIVFLDAATMGDTSLEKIASLGELTTYPTSTPEQAEQRVVDAEVLIVNKIKVTDSLMAKAPKLKLVCEAATGVNNIDLEAAERRGIPVKNVAGYSSDSVAQLTWTQILSLCSGAQYYDARVKDGTYSRSDIFTDLTYNWNELTGKVLGVIGMGTIGARVARIGEAFGMKTVYFSTSGTSHCKEYPSLPLDEFLSISDIVTIHAPLNSRTSGLIGEMELRMMKPTAFLVNAGRGGIVDEKALSEAVDSGIIAGAALDVYEREPLLPDSPLLAVKHPERFRFTPHTAWASVEARRRLADSIADNIRNYCSGESI